MEINEASLTVKPAGRPTRRCLCFRPPDADFFGREKAVRVRSRSGTRNWEVFRTTSLLFAIAFNAFIELLVFGQCYRESRFVSRNP